MFGFGKKSKQKKKLVANDTDPSIWLEYGKNSYHNHATGQGTSVDQRSSGHFVHTFIPFYELEAMYEDNGLAGRMIDLPVDDMFKNWRVWEGSNVEAIIEEEKRVSYKFQLKEWTKAADVYGGAVLIPLILGQDDLEQPLDLDAIDKGDLLKWFILDPNTIKKFVTNYVDPTSPTYLQPEYYILPTTDGTVNIHPSRVFELDGIRRPVRRRINGVHDLWGQSRLARYYDSVRTYEEVMGSTAQSVTNSNIDVIAEEGMSDALTTEEEANIIQRASTIARLKSKLGILIQDKSAEYSRQTSNFSGLAPTIETVQEDCSMVSGIPATKLFGKAKAGMSGDTNDGDIRNYNSDLEIRQDDFSQHLRIPDEIMIRSATGMSPEQAGLTYTWAPISVVTDSEAATIEKDRAAAAQTRIDSGQIAPEEARSALENNPLYKLDEAAFKRAQEEKKKEQANEQNNSQD